MKRIFVTGASRGIGRAIAEKLSGEGATLLLHGRDEKALAETCGRVDAKGGQPITFLCDLREPREIEKMVAEIGSEPLDALINNAGIAIVKPFESITLEEWLAGIAINVTAPFLLTQKLAPLLRPGSSIVNILSIAAKTGFPGWSAYCMSKFALEGFSQSIREELRARRIRVLHIYPAATDTEIWSGADGDWPRDKMMTAEHVAEAVVYALSQPPEIAVENMTLSNVAGSL